MLVLNYDSVSEFREESSVPAAFLLLTSEFALEAVSVRSADSGAALASLPDLLRQWANWAEADLHVVLLLCIYSKVCFRYHHAVLHALLSESASRRGHTFPVL